MLRPDMRLIMPFSFAALLLRGKILPCGSISLTQQHIAGLPADLQRQSDQWYRSVTEI